MPFLAACAALAIGILLALRLYSAPLGEYAFAANDLPHHEHPALKSSGSDIRMTVEAITSSLSNMKGSK